MGRKIPATNIAAARVMFYNNVMYGADTDPGNNFEKRKIPHYYGDVIRVLFVLGAFIMLVTQPFFNQQLPFSIPLSLLAITLLVFVAGLTNPRHRWLAIVNAVFSIIAVIIFGYFSVAAYVQYSPQSLIFWVDEILAIIFLIALYYSAKTVRGMLSR